MVNIGELLGRGEIANLFSETVEEGEVYRLRLSINSEVNPHLPACRKERAYRWSHHGNAQKDACCRWRIWSDGMFGLLESCKLNKVNFGEYIEDILTRILMGEEVDASFLPCDYVRHFEDGTDAEVTKTSQAVAWLLNFRKSKLYSKILVRLTRW